MTLHKLTAGDGYAYLTRQVAAHDATQRGPGSLGDYYSEKGEAPGVWMGRGLAGVPDFPVEGQVTEGQMVALFGQGRHPNAAEIEKAARRAGMDPRQVDQASRLGTPYRVFDQANEFRRRCAENFREHNLARGLDAVTPVPEHDRARIRTSVASAMFLESYGRRPADSRERSGHLARISRQATTAVAGYDLTFSPVKSVSTLWAIAPPEVAAVIEQAHADAVADTLTWMEDHAAYSRVGRNGVAQVDVRGLIAAAFTHRDSRAGDPDLHTHVAVSNKVQALDGRWLALDGRLIYKNKVAASERYNTRLEGLLIERLGVRFADRPSIGADKRPVREIVGVDGPLPRFWSSRRTAIDVRRAVLATRFQAEHGRPPTALEAVALAQRANLETRPTKHSPRSQADQRANWRVEALRVLGGEGALRAYLSRGLSPRIRDLSPRRPAAAWVAETAAAVIATVQGSRATWQEPHVRAEAERRARSAGIGLAEVDRAVDAVVDAALSPPLSTPLSRRVEAVTPTPLRRRDGSSVYTVAGSALYTSAGILATERAILDAAGRRDGRTVDPEAVEMALLEATANGMQLNPGQVQLVRDLATSGARVQLALAPAGTGKTTALRTLATAWRAGGGTVLGLAPSAAAAAVLREQLDPNDELGTATDTLAKFVHARSTGIAIPRWLPAVDATTLVLIDEAGMAGTAQLAEAVALVTASGGSVRLIGDDRQLSAIGAGGVLRDLATTHGAVSLSQVLRFTDPHTGAPNHAEGAASLALRDGDPAALAYYLDHGRVHVGDLATVVDDAYAAWAADRAAGRDALLLAPSRELVAQLNARARHDRLTADGHLPGREVTLSDGSHAGAGDPIITRRNERTLAISATDWVKNGDRWTVDTVHNSGALDVVHQRTGRRVTLPANYVTAHVTLGYASTVHGAQGITADVTHTVLTGQETRELLYVALTRGRHANHVFVPIVGDGDPHSVITRDALLPPTAVDVLTRILAREETSTSATSQIRTLADPILRLQDEVDRYHHALTTAAENRLGVETLAAIDAAAEGALVGLTSQGAYPVLRAHLALSAVAGDNPTGLLRQALDDPRGLHDARDAAAVPDWRIDPTGQHPAGLGPLPWLPCIPGPLRTDPEWATYLTGRADEVAMLATAVATNAGAWTPTDAPPWAIPLLDRDRDLVADLAVWRATHSVDDTDWHPTGPAQLSAADARAQRTLEDRVVRLLGEPGTVTAQWAPLAHSIDPRIAGDPYWPILADRLAIAERAGIDVAALALTAADRPLPDEQPAAALWWRLAQHLSPATTTATGPAGSRTLRTNWTPALVSVLGAAAADRVLADPAWPALVAAVETARAAGWPAEQLLATAHELLVAGQPDDEPPRPEELTTALVWRIGLLVDPTSTGGTAATVPPPADLHQLPAAGGALDDDWLAGLVEPDGPEDGPTHPPHPYTGPLLPSAPPAGAEPYPSPRIARQRLLELNRQAADFFTTRYRDSWASAYLAERLGTALADDKRFILGYAPGGWTTLTDHLRRRGATDAEIVAAGLGSYASTGRVIDRFRDRLVFAIRDGAEIHGWIGRRNPTHDQDSTGHPVPKYLNTADTDLFAKGHELFGLTEGTAALAAGATSVLVEGPVDALAVTLAGQGQYVGLAPLGTAFTDAQADQLRTCTTAGRRVIVATDADPAGQLAAERIFWRLTNHGDNPRHLVVPTGKDPAELLQTTGPAALRQALDASSSLASALIDARIAAYADRVDTVEGRVHAARRAAQIIAAVPAANWPTHLTQVVVRTGIAPDIALSEVFDAARVRNTSGAGGPPQAAGSKELLVAGSSLAAAPDPVRLPPPAGRSAALPPLEPEAEVQVRRLADDVRAARAAEAVRRPPGPRPAMGPRRRR